MNLINVNRKIFNKLRNDKELINIYLLDIIISIDLEEELINSYDNLVEGLYSVISKNEDLIKKVGIKKYYHNDFEAKDYIEGCWYATGKFGLIAFDWSMENENDENWNYSFNVFKIL